MELDIENFDDLRTYLMRQMPQESGRAVFFEKLLGGVSNRTVKVTWDDGRGWVLKQALAKLRVNEDWFSSPDRIQVEARALRWLNRLAPPGTTPSFVFQDPVNHLMAMEAVPEEHENWKSVLLSARVDPALFEQFGFLLGTIHRLSSESGPELRREFADTSFFASLRLDPYYLFTARRIPAAASFLNALAQETLSHKLSLVHGDFSPKNTLLYQDKLILLDYEVVHFGDSAFDVGFALTHFLSKAHHVRQKRAALAAAAELFWRVYFKEVEALGWDALESRTVRHTLACLLARVAGKSPLEYLTPQEAARQSQAALILMAKTPIHVADLIGEFLGEIETDAAN